MAKRHMIQFEVEDKAYAVDSADLAGVAIGCPFVTYPGLPEGVSGLVQWSGRIFPVVAPFTTPFTEIELNSEQCTFLFSVEIKDGVFSEVAIAVPAKVRAWFPTGDETVEVEQLDVVKVVADVCGAKGKKHAA